MKEHVGRISELRAAGRLVKRTSPAGDRVECVEKASLLRLDGFNPDGSLDILASDASVDRYGDVVEPTGWDLADYRRNPVILIDHEYRVSRIVGRAEKAAVIGEGLRLRIRLDPPESNPTAEMVHSRLKTGSLRSVSVGFLPVQFERIVDAETGLPTGFRFLEQELLEVSFVAVPANPNAGTLGQQ
jgi:HK97 family phage prohead protease